MGVMSEIEHAKAFQMADLRGHVSQIIIGQHKRLKIDLLPYRLGRSAKPSLPEVEMLLRLGHGVILAFQPPKVA